jgi:DNA-binding MltR family transcriptional regulator
MSGGWSGALDASTAVADPEAFVKYFATHSDRGAALAVVAYLDHALGLALKSRLVDDKGVVDPMFAPDGMLGGYGARLRMAYLIGLLTKDTYRDLVRLGDIRNDFAHKPELLDFSRKMIKGKCASIGMLLSIRRGDDVALPRDARRLVTLFRNMGLSTDKTGDAFLAYAGIMTVRFMKLAIAPRSFGFKPF